MRMSMRSLAQRPRMHPPLRLIAPRLVARRDCASAVFSIDRKAGRARARHPRQPGAIGGAAAPTSTSPITGWMRIAGASRSLVPAASASTQSSSEPPSSGQAVASHHVGGADQQLAVAQASAANTSLVATGTRGLTSTHGIFGRLSGSSFSPTPVMTQAREARHTGTSAPVAARLRRRRGSSSARSLAAPAAAAPPRHPPNRRRCRRRPAGSCRA